VARELFLDRGARLRAPKSGPRNKGLRWNWSVSLSRIQAFSKKKIKIKKCLRRIWIVFLSRKQATSVLQKKGLRRIWSVFLSQNWLRIQVSGGQKSSRGGQNISRRAVVPCPLLSAPMGDGLTVTRVFLQYVLHRIRIFSKLKYGTKFDNVAGSGSDSVPISDVYHDTVIPTLHN